MTRSKKAHGGIPVEHAKQLPRLRRVEGQIRGLQQMITGDRECLDVIHQISAAISALRRVQSDMLRDHIAACAEAAITGKASKAEQRQLANEISTLLKRLG